MRNILVALALVGGMSVAATAHAAAPLDARATVQPVYWSGDYCGPRCEEHRYWRHRHWESRRYWPDRRYGYHAYRRY